MEEKEMIERKIELLEWLHSRAEKVLERFKSLSKIQWDAKELAEMEAELKRIVSSMERECCK